MQNAIRTLTTLAAVLATALPALAAQVPVTFPPFAGDSMAPRRDIPPVRLRLQSEAPPVHAPLRPDAPTFIPIRLPISGPSPYLVLATGEFIYSSLDLTVEDRGQDFSMMRKYRSGSEETSALGHGWDFSFNVFIEPLRGDLILHDGNSRRDWFQRQADGTYVADQLFCLGVRQPGGSYDFVFPDGAKWCFGALDGSPGAGRITNSIDRNGNSTDFQYDGMGHLTTVLDSLGRSYDFTYDPITELLITVNDFTGREVTYDYYEDGDAGGSAGDLKSVTSPVVTGTPTGNDFASGKATTYTYTTGFQDEHLNHNLLSVTNPKGQTFVVNTYDATFDRVTELQVGDPGEVFRLDYSPVRPTRTNAGAVLTVEVEDRNGFVDQYSFDSFNRMVSVRELTVGLRPSDPAFYETIITWNNDSLPTSILYPEGNRDLLRWEVQVTPNGPARSRGNLVTVTRFPGPRAADQPSLVEEFEYDNGLSGVAGHNFITRHVDARGNETTHDYDSSGNRTQTQHPIPGIVEDWEYNALGQETRHILPDNGSGQRRTEDFGYFDGLDGFREGYLKDVTIDLGGLDLTTTFDVDERGNTVRATDPEGNEHLRVFNELDQVVRETSPETAPGSGIRYTTDTIYDANDNIVRIDIENRDETGVLLPNSHFTTTFEFDTLNNLLRVTEEVDSSSDIVTEFEYDANRNATLRRSGEATNGNQPDNQAATTYDERDLLFQNFVAPGTPEEQLFTVTYDGNRNPVRRESHGRDELFRWDGYDRLVLQTDPMGNERELTYDANGNTTRTQLFGEAVDHPGGVNNILLFDEDFIFDPLDRLVTHFVAHFDDTGNPVGDGQSVTQFTWTDSSQIATTTDDNGNVESREYDAADRVVRIVDAESNEARTVYDDNDNVVRIEELSKSGLGAPDALSGTDFGYDGLDRLVLETTDLGHTTTHEYDSRDNRVLTTDPEGNETRTEYDGLSRVLSETEDLDADGASAMDPDDAVTTTAWDDSGRVTRLTDPEGNATVYVYDARDRCTDVQFADGTSQVCGYDPCGNAVSCTDPNGSQVMKGYDELNRLRFVNVVPGPGVSSDTTLEVFDFDGLGRMVAAQDDDSTVAAQYDSLGNVVREQQNGIQIDRVFDGNSNRLELAYPSGLVITQQYDGLNRTVVSLDNFGVIYQNFWSGPFLLEGRDRANNTVMRCFFDLDRRPVQVDYVFDPGGANQPIEARAFGLNPNGTFSTEQNLLPGGELRTYVHDDLDRLVQSTLNIPLQPPVVTNYDLDRVGNRLQVAGGAFPGPYSQDPQDAPVNQYTQTPLGARGYDDNGNLVSMQVGGGLPHQCVYDFRNRLVEFIDQQAGLVHRYAYDVFGRRISSILDADGAAQETHFIYDGWQVIEELDSFGIPQARFVNGEQLDDVVVMERGGQLFFFQQDVNSSVTSVSDLGGIVVERYVYDDYGATAVFDAVGNQVPGSNIGNPYLFTGRRFDPESGLYYFRHRYFDPTSGLFLTRDPLGLWGDPANRGHGLSFVGNSVASLRAHDPLGLRTPTKRDTAKRNEMVNDSASPAEISSFDAAIANAGRRDLLYRTQGGTWIVKGQIFRTYLAMMLYYVRCEAPMGMFGVNFGNGCKQIVKGPNMTTGLLLNLYKPRSFPPPADKHWKYKNWTYVTLNGTVWVSEKGTKGPWRPTALEMDKNKKGVEVPKKENGKLDSDKMGRQTKKVTRGSRAPKGTTHRG